MKSNSLVVASFRIASNIKEPVVDFVKLWSTIKHSKLKNNTKISAVSKCAYKTLAVNNINCLE